MMILTRFRDENYELVRDLVTMQAPCPRVELDVMDYHPAASLSTRRVSFYLAYAEYEVDLTGVLKIYVYLPEGTPPPEEGTGALDSTKSP